MEREDVIQLIKENLTLDVNSTSEYVGDMGEGGNMYEERHTIEILFDGQVISSIDI